MLIIGNQSLEVRPAAKAILTYPNSREILLVSGESGRPNLLGGGIEMDENKPGKLLETPRQTLLRELGEEAGIEEADIEVHHDPFEIKGETTSAKGVRRVAHWFVYVGAIVTSRELIIGNEVKTLLGLTPEALFAHKTASRLAQRSVKKAMDKGMILRP